MRCLLPVGRNKHVLLGHVARRQQRVTTKFDVLRSRVVRNLFPLGQKIGVAVLHVEATAEGENDRFEANVCCFVDCFAGLSGLVRKQMVRERILRDPRRDHPVHPAIRQ